MPQDAAARQDYGIFGPDSVTWRVFAYPTSISVGFLRTVVTEMFEPFLSASVDDTGAVLSRPAVRYDRTLQYTATIAFADSAAAVKAADVLMRIHSKILGTEPISGKQYDANNPDSQLWIHLTQWHSVLYVYERFGPGKLSHAEEEQYWAECRLAAEFQTIDPESVPRNRDEMRAYFDRMLPVLATTVAAQETVEFMLDHTVVLFRDAPRWLRPAAPLIALVMRKAVIASLPRWMRKIGGLHQGRVQDAIVTAALRPLFRLAHRNPKLTAEFVGFASPNSYPVIAPVLLDIQPIDTVTVTPTEAWAAAGRPMPREQYAALLEQRAALPPAVRAEVDTGQVVSFA